MPTFEEYIDLVRSQLFYMQPVQTVEAVQLDEVWLRTQYDEIVAQPIAKRTNELIVAQRWEEERKRREQETRDAAKQLS